MASSSQSSTSNNSAAKSSTTNSAQYASLAEILSGSKNQSRPNTRSNTSAATLLPSLEDLQKKLDGNKESCTKLNFSRAFGLGTFNFDSIKHEEKPPELKIPVNNHKIDLDNKNVNFPDDKSMRQHRRENRTNKRNDHFIQNDPVDVKTEHSFSDINNDSYREIIHIINQIEKNKYLKFADNDSKDDVRKDIASMKPMPEFNLIQLPNDFNLEHGQVNVYQSGIIEIVSGDQPPVIYRLKRTTRNDSTNYLNIEPLTTGLVITTDSQVYIDKMNVCVPVSLDLGNFSTKTKDAIINDHQISPEAIIEKIKNFSQIKTSKHELRTRPPIVTIMGHVDHGKTTLLDSIRKSELVKQEHGGITQHIGAFVVSLQDKTSKESRVEDLVVFLDTPGHKAFSSMRERGALVTDIVVLVVAADDGVMEQTVESISFAQKSQVPIIVAINKIDKIKDNPVLIENVKIGLKSQGITLEEDGGDIQSIKISALNGQGIHELKEAIVALAETLELKAPIDCNTECSIIESSIHPHRGRLTTMLVQKGILKRSNILVSTNSQGNVSWAKVRSMFDEYGQVVNEAKPGFPVQVIGWRDDTLPDAGDYVWQLNSEKQVKEIIAMGKELEKKVKESIDRKAIEQKREEHDSVYKADLKARREAGIRYKRKRATAPRTKLILTEGDEMKTSIVLKADVNGSLEVLLDIFDSFPNDSCPAKLNLVHYGLGNVTENDIELASCFPNGMIYTFNVGVFTPSLLKLSKELNVPIKRFNVIYHLVDHLLETIKERMPFVKKEEVLGEAVVIQEFLVNEKRKKVPVAGCRCLKGVLKKNNVFYKLIRTDQVVAQDLKLSSMRHHKDEVDTIKKDFECGLTIADNVITSKTTEPIIRFQPQDKLVCYELTDVRLPLKWTPKGF